MPRPVCCCVEGRRPCSVQNIHWRSCCSERKLCPCAPKAWHSLFDRLLPVFHQQPDGGGCSVELGHLVLVNDAPHSPNVGVGGDTFKLSRRQGSDSVPSLVHPPEQERQEQQGTAAGPWPVLIEISETCPVQGPLTAFWASIWHHPTSGILANVPQNTLTAQALGWHSPSSPNGPACMVRGRRSKHSDTIRSTKNPKKGSPNMTVIILLAFPQGAQASGSLSRIQATAKRDTSTGVKCRLSLEHQQCKQPSLPLTRLSHHPQRPGLPAIQGLSF